MFRRQALDRGAVMLNVDKIVTGTQIGGYKKPTSALVYKDNIQPESECTMICLVYSDTFSVQ